MKKTISFFVFVLGVATLGNSQALLQPIGARYLTLGAYSQQNVDIYASRANPASLAQLQQASVGIYGERRFLLQDLNLYTLSAGLPTKSSGTFALHGSYFGFNLSNQTQLSLAYGRSIGKKVDVGASFDYRQLSQQGIYGKASAITGSVGLLFHLTNKIHAGVYAYNPIRISYGKDKEERLPSNYSFGIGYDASDKLYVSAELQKEEGQKVNLNAGFQYRFIEQFFIRGGMATQTNNYFVGVGFNLKKFRMDIATSYHPQLGLSPGLLLMFNLSKKKDAAAQ